MSLRFADDRTGYFSDTSTTVLQFMIYSELRLLSFWFDHNCLQINTDKTQALPIRPCSYEYDLALNGNKVETQQSIKIIGVTLHRMLTFKEHILLQLKKACTKLSALRCMNHLVPTAVIIHLYKAFMLPHFEYCNPLLLGVGRIQVKRIEDANFYISRSLLTYRRSTLHEELLSIANMNTLEHRRICQSLVLHVALGIYVIFLLLRSQTIILSII